MKRILLVLPLVTALLAAKNETVTNGISIYVVTAVVLIAWTGIALYLFRLDRKTDRILQDLEKE
jgi:CcmD family protein